MGFEMRNLNQLIIKFDYEQNFKDDDFYVSKSNEHVFSLLNKWPKWGKNFLNISGEKFSGKTHLVNIFQKKFKGVKFNANLFTNNDLKKIKIYENIILEDIDRDIDEKLIYSLLNIVDLSNKFIIVTSAVPIVNINFSLPDLKSRTKNFLLLNIEKPDDELMFALILKNLSDRQILIDKKLINFIIKRIDRSYGKIIDFIYKVDELSLKKKKPIDFKIIKEILGE
jgi:chromosomal replication initiation ATPase DnaA